MKEPMNQHKKPLIFYYVIAMLVVLLLNTLLFPLMTYSRYEEVDYRTFMTMLEEGKISAVEVQDKEIYFTPADVTDKSVYVTGRMEDPDLVNRLYASNVEQFTEIAPEERSSCGSGWEPSSSLWPSAAHLLLPQKEDDRRQRHAVRFQQRQGLCGRPDRQNLCRCGG